ncbi:MAG: aspartate/glutamate racemase family protein [Cyanobacteria bacterium P01_F01_bin.86]
MSWSIPELYYRQINEMVKQKLGGLHSAQIAMVSVNFQAIEELQHTGQWEKAGALLAKAAQQIEAAGADFLLICTNTMHKVAPQIEREINIPILHLADATAEQIKQKNISSVGLLGTNFTMEQDFYRGRLCDRHGLNVIVPSAEDRQIVHQIIYEELCLGIVKEDSRKTYLTIMEKMREEGAEGVIEGCTEIVMLVQQQHTSIPLFDTTAIHAEAAVTMALRL